METLKIAFYSDTYLPAMDGVVNSIINFRKELERRGHEVYLFTTSNAGRYSPKDKIFVFRGINFRPYPQYKMPIFPYRSTIKMASMNFDIIHAQTPFMMGFSALISAKLLDLPIVGSFHTMVKDRHVIEAYYPKSKPLRKFTSKYLWKYTKFFYRRCKATIVPSNTIKAFLEKQNVRNTFVVPNGIDLSRFNPKIDGSKVRDTLNIPPGKKVILYIGRLSNEKRVDVIIRAFWKLSKKRDDIVLVIGGTGPAAATYKHLANRLGLSESVKFLNFVSERMLPSVYAASDVFATASKFETQSISSIEAMAMGKPVVGANMLALKEIIKNGVNGEKFEPDNYDSCARKLNSVLNNLRSYKKNAIKTANSFSIEKTTDKLLYVYNLILSSKE
ncbi:MAG: glycosyltransferase [Candidatus Micrarchaeaceae archaeon]